MKADNCKEETREIKDPDALEIAQLEPFDESLIASSIRRKLEAISFPSCIFHVPTKFLIQNEGAYHPKMVSIGPLHHGKPHLHLMESLKWGYLNSLLGRNLNLDVVLSSSIRALRELESKIRASYQGDLLHLRSKEFLTMILVDAGFIIELFLRYSVRGLRRRDDSLFKSPEKFHVLRSDLILLENQIPFFVLKSIFSIVPFPGTCDRSLEELSLRFFKILISGDVQSLQEKYNFEGSSHLLDLIWKCYLPSSSKISLKSGSQLRRDLLSATKLRKEGIKIRKVEAESILDIRFTNGKLRIPVLRVHNYMETLFRNMIVLEHYHVEKMKHVTSYVYLMKCLLFSDKDVQIFTRQKIFEKKGQVIALFKSLCDGVDLDLELEEFTYDGMWEQVMAYRQKQHGMLAFTSVFRSLFGS